MSGDTQPGAQSPHRPMGRGLFVAVEGVDGAGTTTQVHRLTSWLASRGQSCVATREPSDGPVGVLIRQILKGRLRGGARGEPFASDALALLFAADRLDHVASEIEPALADGAWVVSDRYLHSSLAYQCLDLPLEWVAAANARAMAPDCVIYVDVPVHVALERISRRQGDARERFEHEALLSRVIDAYDRFAADGGSWLVVDGTPSADSVHQAITSALMARWPSLHR